MLKFDTLYVAEYELRKPYYPNKFPWYKMRDKREWCFDNTVWAIFTYGSFVGFRIVFLFIFLL